MLSRSWTPLWSEIAMNRSECVILFALALPIGLPGPSRPANPRPQERESVAPVQAVFSARCATCHGPDVLKPRGGFGYVLDLRRLAGNPNLIVPSSPEQSELWLLVRNGEMPPPDAPQLTVT